VFPVSLTVSPIRDAHGTVVAASVISRDVSELKHAAQYARSLIEASLDPMETISTEGKITDVNEAAVKAAGVPESSSSGPTSPATSSTPTRPTPATTGSSSRGR
jgi:PAS domain-containing protein